MNQLEIDATESRPTILVVDDHKIHRTFLVEILAAQGYDVEEAQSSLEASDLLTRIHFDLILLDWDLSGCQQGDPTGKGVLRQARELDPDALVVVMSALLTGSVANDAYLTGADSFLQKASGNEILLSHISQLIRRRRKNDALAPRDEKEILPLEEVQRRYVGQVVKLLNNNISCAARALGVHRHTVSAMIANESGRVEALR